MDASWLRAGNLVSAESWRGLNITKTEKDSLSDTEQMMFVVYHACFLIVKFPENESR